MKANPKEINRLVLEYQKEEDQEKRDSIFDTIFESQENMIKMFISDAAIRMGEIEDLRQELIYAMLECINKYKGDTGANFNTYLLFYLKKGRKVWARFSRTINVQQHAKNKQISFVNIDSQSSENSNQTISQSLISKFDWDSYENKLDLKARIDKLKDIDLDIILKILEGYTLVEAATELKLDKQYISSRYYKILNNLKEK